MHRNMQITHFFETGIWFIEKAKFLHSIGSMGTFRNKGVLSEFTENTLALPLFVSRLQSRYPRMVNFGQQMPKNFADEIIAKLVTLGRHMVSYWVHFGLEVGSDIVVEYSSCILLVRSNYIV